MRTSATCLIADSLDDLLRAAIETVLARGENVAPSRGTNREVRGVTLQLTNPRARLSRSESRGKVFSALGELLWYLSGSNATDWIAYYIPQYRCDDEDGLIWGGYGPRLRGDADQLARVIGQLRAQPSTRRAVVQLFDAGDVLDVHKDVPCTCTLQFLSREAGLDLVVHMRSNDVYVGLPHDVFCFTMLHELVARSIGVDVGQYLHIVGSLHLYDVNATAARHFLDEGYHWTTAMPPMPTTDPLRAVDALLNAEAQLRSGADPLTIVLPPSPYWADLARLLVVFALDRDGRHGEIPAVMAQMTTDVYDVHVQDRLDRNGDGR